mgnify:CR=1 FL=1
MTDSIDKARVVERVDDWVRRVETLYTLIEHVVANVAGVACEKSSNMTMHEELMHKYGVPPQQISILDIRKNGKIVVSFKPVGLWVVGANGRIDILMKKGGYYLVDKADFGQPPRWEAFPPQNKRAGIPFDATFILDLVRQA